jgi:hypothetical protein
MSILITVPGETFLTKGVRIGDTVKILTVNGSDVDSTHYLLKSGSNQLDYDALLVSEVVSETSFNMEAYKNGVTLDIDATMLNLASKQSFTFDIIHNLSKDEQVDQICAIAQGYANKRVVLVWPPKADYIINSKKVTVDGSALAAALAAAKSIYPAQQSMTNMPFAGPYQLYYSNNYFTPTQLNRLSDAGVLVLVQDAVGADIYARHQKTTSNVSIQEQEMSITNAIDKISIDIAAIGKPFIGKFNITQDLLTQLQDVFNTYLFNAQSHKSPYCGSLILSYTAPVLRANLDGQNTDLPPGRLQVSLTVEIGYPANYIDILVYIQ